MTPLPGISFLVMLVVNMKIGLVIMVSMLSANSIACIRPPDVQSTGVNQLIQRASTIVLAYVIEAKYFVEDYRVEYTFKVDKILKGQSSDYFKLDGYPLIGEGGLNTFDNHVDSIFWESGAGRLVHHPDCLIHPTFSVGATYLVFLDEPYHNKSFEQIVRTHGDVNTKDKWLQYVEKQTISRVR